MGQCSTGTIQELIHHCADINAVNKDRATPLLLACSTAQIESMRLLLQAKADPNIADTDGDTSLHAAIVADCSNETLKDIIDHGADVNAVNKRGRTALLLSCFYRYMDSVKVLLGVGADPAISDEDGFSCLHAAIDGYCNKDTLQALIDHGVHIDAKREDGTNALLSACRTQQSASVMFLLEAGADVNIVKPDGNTSLHVAVDGHCSKEALEQIIQQTVNVNVANDNGQTALTRACDTAQAEAVTLLLKYKADPNISDATGNTSLYAAVYGNCPYTTLQEIIAHKANIDAQNIDGETALYRACLTRQQDSVRILLKAAAHPNIPTNAGNTSSPCCSLWRLRQKDCSGNN